MKKNMFVNILSAIRLTKHNKVAPISDLDSENELEFNVSKR